MIEVRPVEPKEAEEFLAMLCDIFNLDFERARSVFFSEPFFDIRRKWAVFENESIQSILTVTPLIFGWGNAIGIAGVATKPEVRKRGLARSLLSTVLDYYGQPALLFTTEPSIYLGSGFSVIDDVVRAPLKSPDNLVQGTVLSTAQVHEIYSRWAEGDSGRLRRDAQRWNYWNWSLRMCEQMPGGYVCTEAGICREAIVEPGLPEWPVTGHTEWLGLRTMTERIAPPIGKAKFELHLMGRGFSEPPQMFMTDQF